MILSPIEAEIPSISAEGLIPVDDHRFARLPVSTKMLVLINRCE